MDREVEELADRVAAAKKVSPFLNTEHAAFYIGLSASGLEKMRRKGRGPKFRHHGRHIRYHIDDLDAWSMERGDESRRRVAMKDLKLAKLPDRNPVKLTVIVSPDLNRRLGNYADLYKQTYGQEEPVAELVPFMLETFLAGDKRFKTAMKTEEEVGVSKSAPRARQNAEQR